MKKLIFLFATILFTISQINATTISTENSGYFYTNGESFNFIEGNIQFMVYKNGEFDFFIQPENFVAAEFHHGDVSITYNSGYDYEAYVQYDDYGAIIQIEGTPIFYDYYGRISRIGDTRIRYNQRRLIQFGSMYVHYNHYGYFDHYTGYINHYNRHHYYHPYFSFYIRPIFSNCVVSYNPYRRYYAPTRYRYRSDNFRRSVRTRRNNVAHNRSVSRRSIPQRVANRKTRDVSRLTNRGISRNNTNKGLRNEKNHNRLSREKTIRKEATRKPSIVRKKSQRVGVSSGRKGVVRKTKSTNRNITQNRRGAYTNKSTNIRKGNNHLTNRSGSVKRKTSTVRNSSSSYRKTTPKRTTNKRQISVSKRRNSKR